MFTRISSESWILDQGKERGRRAEDGGGGRPFAGEGAVCVAVAVFVRVFFNHPAGNPSAPFVVLAGDPAATELVWREYECAISHVAALLQLPAPLPLSGHPILHRRRARAEDEKGGAEGGGGGAAAGADVA